MTQHHEPDVAHSLHEDLCCILVHGSVRCPRLVVHVGEVSLLKVRPSVCNWWKACNILRRLWKAVTRQTNCTDLRCCYLAEFGAISFVARFIHFWSLFYYFSIITHIDFKRLAVLRLIRTPSPAWTTSLGTSDQDTTTVFMEHEYREGVLHGWFVVQYAKSFT